MIPLERIREQIVEVTTPQITEEVSEVKEMITDQMNMLQFTDDADVVQEAQSRKNRGGKKEKEKGCKGLEERVFREGRVRR